MAISIHFEKIPDNSTKTRNIPSNYVIQSRKSFQSNPKDVVSCTPVLLSHSHPFFFFATLGLSTLRHLVDDRKFATIGQGALNRSPDILFVPGLGNKLFLAGCKQSLSSRFTTRNPFFQVIVPSERVKVGRAFFCSAPIKMWCFIKNFTAVWQIIASTANTKSIHQIDEGLRQILGCRLWWPNNNKKVANTDIKFIIKVPLKGAQKALEQTRVHKFELEFGSSYKLRVALAKICPTDPNLLRRP